MGQQQLLIVIVGVVIVGIAIAAGINVFTAMNIANNRDAIMQDLQTLSKLAYGYRLRPVPFGGGGSVYAGFKIPPQFVANENGSYEADPTLSSVTFTATSRYGYGTITATLDSSGCLEGYSYAGMFER